MGFGAFGALPIAHLLDVRLGIPHNHVMINLNERYWSKVAKVDSGCWEWTAQTNNKGYGMVRVRYLGFKEKQLAHRISYLFHKGEIPKGLYVLHTCDNPKCVNPDHLFVGDDKDNVHDMWNKGRASAPPVRSGTDHWKAVLSASQVDRIRKAFGAGERITEIARRMGVSRHVASRAAKGKTYAQL